MLSSQPQRLAKVWEPLVKISVTLRWSIIFNILNKMSFIFVSNKFRSKKVEGGYQRNLELMEFRMSVTEYSFYLQVIALPVLSSLWQMESCMKIFSTMLRGRWEGKIVAKTRWNMWLNIWWSRWNAVTWDIITFIFVLKDERLSLGCNDLSAPQTIQALDVKQGLKAQLLTV